MKNIVKQYTHNIAWSAMEATIFQIILCAHQTALFYSIPSLLYGLTGTIFGLVYFTVKLFDLGLSKSLITFYHEFTASKHSYILFFKHQLLPNTIFCFIFFLCLWIIYIFFPSHLSIILPINNYVLFFACGLTVTESIKIILKRLLQLSSSFRCVAFYEISFMLSYPLMVWLYYFYLGSLNEYVIIGCCFLASAVECLGLCHATYHHYALLPTFTVNNEILLLHQHTVLEIFKSRFFIYGHSISKQFSSGNVLIPLFAYIYGFEYAALLKLTSYITHSISTVMEKILDSSNSVLFAHIINETHAHKKEFFLLALHISWHILLCILIFTTINSAKIFSLSYKFNNIMPFVLVYFLIHYSENFFVTLEKFYIVHNYSKVLTVGTILNSFVALILFIYALSPLFALILFLISRIITFLIFVYFLSYTWNIKTRITIMPRYIVGTLIISILCKIIF